MAFISFLIAIFWFNGWCINSETIDNIYYYREQAQIINKNMANKTYQNRDEITLEIKNLVDEKFYNKNIISLRYNVEEIRNLNRETYQMEEIGVKFKELYIPTNEEIEKIKKHKNKVYDNSIDFELMLKSLKLKNEFIDIVKDNVKFAPDIKNQAFVFFLLFSVIASIISIINSIFFKKEKEEKTEIKEEIKEEEKNNPEKIKPVLDYAKVELQEQMAITKNQAKKVFNISVFALFFGTALLLVIIFKKDIPNKIAIITAIGGVIGEIAGGFLLIMYKSLISQLNENLKILERLNFIAVGTKIIDTLETDNKEEINKAKIGLAEKIIDKIHY